MNDRRPQEEISMKRAIPIIHYTDYMDVPRVFVISFEGLTWFFDAGFDKVADEYPDEFKVFVFPPMDKNQILSCWSSVVNPTTAPFTTVGVRSVSFSGCRKNWSVDEGIVRRLYDQYRTQNSGQV